MRDYYSLQFYNTFTPGHPHSLPLPEELPDTTYQYTCEFGGLFKTLLLMPDTIWSTYTHEQKDKMAECISKWGHHRTTQNNRRIFNIVTLALPGDVSFWTARETEGIWEELGDRSNVEV